MVVETRLISMNSSVIQKGNFLCAILLCFFLWVLSVNIGGSGLTSSFFFKPTIHSDVLKTLDLPSLPYNTTLYVPGASHVFGTGNLALPSGRFVHAFRNAEFSLAVGEVGSLFVTVRTENKEVSPMFLSSKAEITHAISNGLLWHRGLGTENSAQAYYVIDTLYDAAFGHWVLESAVFLSYWAELKGTFPNLKLVFRQPRKYKSLFLPAFGVSIEDVLYLTGGCPLTSLCKNLPPYPHAYPLPNLVLIPPGQYLHDGELNEKLFHETLIAFVKTYKEFSRIPGEGGSDVQQPVRTVLILPRGRKENYGPNDRSIPELDILASLVDDGEVLGAEVLRTDEVKDFKQQVNALRRAKVIFVGAGSSAYINVLFAFNATVYVLGPDRIKTDSRFPFCRILWDLARVEGKNTVIIRDDSIEKKELRSLLLNNI